MSKYGFENFYFKILQDNISSKQELDKQEKYYIKKYKSLITQNGYNVELGRNGIGKHSEETKRKIGDAQRGEKNHMYGKYGSQNATSKKIIELTTGQVFESASLAAKHFNLNFSHICAVARGNRGSTGGYVFRYLNKNDQIILPDTRVSIKSKEVKNNILPEYIQYI